MTRRTIVQRIRHFMTRREARPVNWVDLVFVVIVGGIILMLFWRKR